MKYLQFTHVDAVTGISVAAEPAQNGPVFPAITGLQFEWARESQYPTTIPAFFGTCPDDSFIYLDGMTAELSLVDYEQMRADEMSARRIRTVSMRQARLRLLALGSYATVNATIPTMPEEAQVEWEYATEVQRTNPLVTALVQLLGWSEADTDLYFTEAAKL